jgi:hypothetical protein
MAKGLEAPILARVGLICRACSTIEYAVASVIWAMLELDPETGKIVTGGLDMQPRLNMAIALARHKSEPKELVASLETARKELQDGLLDRRNLAVHGIPLTDVAGLATLEVHRGRYARKPTPRGFDEIKALSDEIVAVMNALAAVTAPYVLSRAEKIAARRRTTASESGSVSGS